MKKIVLVGGGGHCKVVISILKDLDEYDIVGISDLPEKLGEIIHEIPIKYTDEELPKLRNRGIEYALVTLGSIGNPEGRIRLYNKLKSLGYKLPVIISPKAIISDNVKIGEGTVVMPGALINPGVKIGSNVIINTGAIIEHDCIIEDHVHIAPGATLSGEVNVGCCSHIGTGANVIQGIKIGSNTIIGAGAVVVKDVPSNVVAKGVPAKW